MKNTAPPPSPASVAILRFSPASVNFVTGSSSQIISLQNTSSTVTVSQLALTAANLSLVNNTCGTSLAPLASCTFQVTTSVSGVGSVMAQGTNSVPATLIASATTTPMANLAFTPGTVNVAAGSNSALVTLQNTSPSVTASGLTLTPAAGITLVSNTCGTTLNPLASCTFRVTSSNLGLGEVVAQATNSNTTQLLTNVVAAPFSLLGVSPTSLNFAINSPAIITVTNLASSTAPAENVTAVTPMGSSLNISANSCPPSLPVNSSCTIELTSAVTEGPTNVAFQGDNTAAPAPTVSLTAVNAPSISVTAPVQANSIIDVGSVTPLEITVTNSPSSPINALNVVATLPAAWTDVVGDYSDCASVAPGASCVLRFTSPTPYVAGTIAISGDNTLSPAPTFNLAFRHQGGLVFSAGSGSGKVVAESDANPAERWSQTNVVVGALSLDDGAANTAAIFGTYGTGSVYAARYCVEWALGGFTDWYLPAACEMTSGLLVACPITDNIYDNLISLGFLNISLQRWSSTEFSATQAYQVVFSTGVGVQSNKSNTFGTRCTRVF